MPPLFSIKIFKETSSGNPIIGMQSKETRAINVGYIEKKGKTIKFIPGRLNLGQTREEDTAEATVQSLRLPQVKKILSSYDPDDISTVTLLRETIACQLPLALFKAGIARHHGDCFIGANHIKKAHSITTSYAYENIEGLNPHGLWIIADSVAAGRNLLSTLGSLLTKFRPEELLFLVPIGNRWGINRLSALVKKKKIKKTTFIVWGALFGLNPENKYDEPWGLPDCEPIDVRDQQTFIDMYGSDLCVGGDFGNDYYCPPLALKLYKEQLKQLSIVPRIPSVREIMKIYKKEELVIR
ncbi:MAG: hypothetical protein UW22_C0028G0012 [Candidatus Gottesmanbacteria bacterium GW2011_GWB1_44_11c]|uniref:Uncharacterized protein n=2 Tax=Candidatus Gottesmaniibacteriota TaxID=1752720 RepID=A0A0G1GRW6_9BACT|nr:MAG: hypothetical protein UW22_C0028G0012 [Candidatus Gottesmanbacteria bacterium GW2011_GWB1_44_11c]HCM82851.1 hypothetical protein [Patescibacteria group bacterium]